MKGVTFPLAGDASCIGTIVDADDNVVMVIDPERERPDAEVSEIRASVIATLNTHMATIATGAKA